MNAKCSFFFVLLFAALSGSAQLKAKVSCDEFTVDILTGKVNDIKADFTLETLKVKFPCYTSTAPDDSAKCGGIFFKDKDLSIFTGRDYIQIGEKFKGKLSMPIMGASRNSFFKTLGNPKIKDDTWDAYQMQYGTLVLHYNKANKVRLIQMSTQPTETLSLCE